MKSYLRSIRISPKKMNLVAKLVRGKPVEEAMNYLQFLPKKSARPIRRAIGSAAANATHNFKQDRSALTIKSIYVTEGSTLHRFRPVSRGRSHPIRKRTTHISVELEVKEIAKKKEHKKGQGLKVKNLKSKS